MPRCGIPVTIDGVIMARFVLETDAEFFAKSFSEKFQKRVTVDFDKNQSPRVYEDGREAF
jgi:hypothetical protein